MRIITGTAVSTKMAKTVVVQIDRQVTHPKYGKKLTRSTKIYAHDPEGRVREGDLVTVRETRPLSKLKRYVVITPERATALRATRSAT